MKSTTLAVLIISLSLLSCSISDPIQDTNISLSEIDVSTTKVYLNLKFKSRQKRELSIRINDTPYSNFTCFAQDTSIVISSLEASSNYTFQILEVQNGKEVAQSNALNVKTLRVTSHDIPWKSFTVSLDNYGVGYDHFVIDLNDIWLVGVFYVGSEVSEYGALHWDGIEWNYLRLYSDTPYTDLKTNITPSGMFAFNEHDIWFADKSVFHWDGDTLTPYWLTYLDGDNPDAIFGKGQLLNSICGNTKNGYVYAYGEGALAVFIENQWHKIPIDPNWNVTDMQEYLNPLTGESEIICSAIDWNIQQGFLFKINDKNGISVIPWDIYIGSMAVLE